MVSYLAIEIFCLSTVDIHGNEIVQGHYFLWWISSLSGIIVINNIFKFINLRFLVVIGRNSMEYYVWHWIIMLALLFACYLMGIVHTLWFFGIVWGGKKIVFVLFLYSKHSRKL